MFGLSAVIKKKKILPVVQQLLSHQVVQVFQGDPKTSKHHRVNLFLVNYQSGDILVFTVGGKMHYIKIWIQIHI